MHFPSLQVSQAVPCHPTWWSASWRVRLRQQMMSQIFCVPGFDSLMTSSTKNLQQLTLTLLRVQDMHISNPHILRIREWPNSCVRSTRRFWMEKGSAWMKEQEFPTIEDLTATMILTSQVGLLILTDLLDLPIHLVCLHSVDRRGTQQLIWSLRLLSLLKNLQGYPDGRRTKSMSVRGQSTRIWAFGNLIWLKVYASLPTTAIEPHGKLGYNLRSGKTLTSMLWMIAEGKGFSRLMRSFPLHYQTLFHKLVM